MVHRSIRSPDRQVLVAAFTAIALAFALSHDARANQAPAPTPELLTPEPTPTDPLAGGSVSFTLQAVRYEGEAYLPVPGTEFQIAVTNGSPPTAVVTTGADGQVSFDVTVMAGHAAALIEITEVAGTDDPLEVASCWYDFGPLLDWTTASSFTVEVEPGWTAGCTFYHKRVDAPPKPTPRLTPPPTDADGVVATVRVQVVPIVLLLLAISAMALPRRRRRDRANGTD